MSMVNCPLCKNPALIRVPPEYSAEFWYYGNPTAQIIDPAKIHRVGGPNCWQGEGGNVLCYRGSRDMFPNISRPFKDVFRPDWTPLRPARSQELINHSPDGFEWGYPGSGPAQLALAILLDHTDNEEFSLKNYQLFKEAFVVHFGETWQIACEQLNVFYHNVENWREIWDEQAAGQFEMAQEIAAEKAAARES